MSLLERDGRGRIAAESAPMRLLRRLGRDDLAWPLRRLHVPVRDEALVLEVGSGGNPYPRANVLLDAFEVTRERHFQPLVADRPTVLGLVERMPFKDDAFDFVIASHVLEHAQDIDAFLRELQRVARAGYIETPDAIFERLNPYTDHRLELTERDGVLLLRPKRAWRDDPELVELYEARLKGSPQWARQLRTNPFAFHLRFYWAREDGGIRYRVLPAHGAIDAGDFVGGGEAAAPAPPPDMGLRRQLVHGARRILSQQKRNAQIDVAALLKCPSCASGGLSLQGAAVLCRACGSRYPVEGNVFRLNVTPGASTGESTRP